MTWIKLDDQFSDHPKVAALSDRAFRLYVQGLCYASRYLTDGLLTSASLLVIRAKPAALAELMDAGLWESSHDEAVTIHDYLKYNPSRSKVEANREAVRGRVTKHRGGDCNTVTGPVTTSVSNAAPVPSRPVPSETLPPGDLDPNLELPGVLGGGAGEPPCAEAPGPANDSVPGKKIERAPREPPDRPHPCPEPSELIARAKPEWWAAQATKHNATIGELERHVPEFCVFWQKRGDVKNTSNWLRALANQFERLSKREVLHSGGVPRGQEIHERTKREAERQAPLFRRRPEPPPLPPAEREAMAERAIAAIARPATTGDP